MEKVFSGEIYEILPLSNGIIFSYCKDYVDGGVMVAYKMASLDTGRVTDVTKKQKPPNATNFRCLWLPSMTSKFRMTI